jgi:hypothetical protein
MSILAAVALTLSTSAALANVIDPSDPDPAKANSKLRADIAKQVSKYTFCLTKAATKCEKKGASSLIECHLNTGVFDNEANEPGTQQKFQDAIAKCDSKLALTKKGTDYVGIGCPGDCNAGLDGVQQCTDIPAFQANVTGTAAGSAKAQLGTLGSAIDFFCGMDIGGMPTDEARIECATVNAKALSKYGSAVFKCQAKCENDFKVAPSKGSGGPTNGAECVAPGPGPATEPFTACVKKSSDKNFPLLSPSNLATVVPLVNTAINDSTSGLYDRFDPTTVDPKASPCGNCGNGTREGAEECDLADDVLCGGPCNADCTCP